MKLFIPLLVLGFTSAGYSAPTSDQFADQYTAYIKKETGDAETLSKQIQNKQPRECNKLESRTDCFRKVFAKKQINSIAFLSKTIDACPVLAQADLADKTVGKSKTLIAESDCLLLAFEQIDLTDGWLARYKASPSFKTKWKAAMDLERVRIEYLKNSTIERVSKNSAEFEKLKAAGGIPKAELEAQQRLLNDVVARKDNLYRKNF